LEVDEQTKTEGGGGPSFTRVLHSPPNTHFKSLALSRPSRSGRAKFAPTQQPKSGVVSGDAFWLAGWLAELPPD
jgi:hypothetical protein